MDAMATRKKAVSRRQDSVGIPKARMLIVDDHEILRQGMRLMLEQQRDLEVCAEAADEATAIRQYRQVRPDVVIVDISLKTGNGIDLIKRIKAVDPSARILVYSMHDEQVYAERALRAGAMGYVTKQKPAQAILHGIRDVLRGKLHFSEELTQRVLERVAANEPISQASAVDNLSDRELEVFEMIGRGLTTRAIADRLHLSPRTVDTYRERLKIKLVLANAAELHYRAIQWVLKGS
ncbi:MAG TPA: response regulator transcription factor [Planctomycetaceae bacterium]|jgi:DNA-binding NarL/FixJ family response regulator|nr:response regulator transcription factor [Planctomycetaceae bacterium]